MNPAPLSRIQTFREQVLLPALNNIEERLEGTQKQVIIASNAETGNDAVDTMLRQMHFGKPYLNPTTNSTFDLPAPSNTPQSWIGESLYVKVLQDLGVDSTRIGQYCLSIEFRIISSEQIQVWSVVGHTKTGDKALQIQQHLFEENLDPALLENLPCPKKVAR
jgi:hypothetical protein